MIIQIGNIRITNKLFVSGTLSPLSLCNSSMNPQMNKLTRGPITPDIAPEAINNP